MKILKETQFWKIVKIFYALIFKASPDMFSSSHGAHILNLSSPLDGLLNAENRLLISFSIFEKSGFDF